MNAIKLNAGNKKAIQDFIVGNPSTNIQGSKFFALLKLIDKKGIYIETTDTRIKNGTKVLQYEKGLYLHIDRHVYRNGISKLKVTVLETV